jgi:restriction system protein
MSDNLNLPYHYPPELLQLMVDAITVLCRSKDDVVKLFRGAGVPNELIDPHALLLRDKETRDLFKKPLVARRILTELNERGDVCLRERREVARRVVQWDNFSTCWENDRDKAISLVAQIRQLVNGKDTLTRIAEEREREAAERRAPVRAELAKKQALELARKEIQSELFSLFSLTDHSKRGKLLESVLNRMFKHYNILIREAFERREPEGGCLEQVDGVIEFDGHLWLVEMKWHSEPLGPIHFAHHMMRAFLRSDVRALLISASGYTLATVKEAYDANQKCVCVLSDLQEFVSCIESDRDLRAILSERARSSIVDKKPYLLKGSSRE